MKAGADYAYDAAGNMTYNAHEAQNYTYDAENRITGAAGYTYTYDADGNRVKKTNGSTGTLYWYMAPGIVAESDLSGNLTAEYAFFAGERIARRDFTNPPTVSYYFSDHLKTASVITDSAGNIKSDSDYYPWGGELEFVTNDSNHYKFTGKERDTETNLDYFGARYYANALGRFITADWSTAPEPVPYADFGDPQSLNLYSYVRNIPTSKADLDGHDGPGVKEAAEITAADWAIIDAVGATAAGPALAAAGLMIGGPFALTYGLVKVAGPVTSDDQMAMGEGQVSEPEGGTLHLATPNQTQTQTEEPPAPEPAPASGGARKGGGKDYDDTPENRARMAQGKPPIGKDKYPMELHSPAQTHKDQSKEMTRTDHRLNGNFKKNHTNTGQRKSKVNRNQTAKDRRAHWKKVHEDKNKNK